MGIFDAECSHCGSRDHASSDCPHGLFSSECSHCGSKAHASDDCPHGLFASACTHCGSTAHASHQCPHGLFSSRCSHCGAVDHSSDNCPHGLFASECSRCGSKNHASDLCPHGFFTSRSERDSSDSRRASAALAPAGNTGCAQVIVVLVLVAIVAMVVLWLLANVVLPLALLNTAVIATIAALANRTRRPLFAALALFGGCYMLLDIANGWFSAAFVRNVVHTPSWLTAFVYVNAVAIAASVWILVQPLWVKANAVSASNKRDGTLMFILVAVCIGAPAVAVPAIYHVTRSPSLFGNPDVPSMAATDTPPSPPAPFARASAATPPRVPEAERSEDGSRTAEGGQRAASPVARDLAGVWRDENGNCLDIEVDRSGRVLYAGFRPCTADSHVVSVGLYLVGSSLRFVGDDREQLVLLSDGTLQGSLNGVPARERVGPPGSLRFHRDVAVVEEALGGAGVNTTRDAGSLALAPETGSSSTDDRSAAGEMDTPVPTTAATSSGATSPLAAPTSSEPAAAAGRSGDVDVRAPSAPLPLVGVLTAIDISTQTLRITTDDGKVQTVTVPRNTPVFYNRETYRIDNLERGDRVRIRFSDLNRERVQIDVLQNVNAQ